jgi:PAS domain S-box-containing protein
MQIADTQKQSKVSPNESIEAKYQMLFENMINGFARHKIVTDEQGKAIDYIFLETNAAFEEIIGMKREKFINKRVTEVLPGIEKDPADWIGRYAKVALENKKIKFQQYSELMNKWFEISAYSSAPGYFDIMVEDISERKSYESSLKKSSEYYKYLLDSLDELVFITDKSGKLVYANQKTIDVCGYSHEEMIGSSIVKYLAKESRKEALTALTQEFIGHSNNALEVGIITKAGEKRIIQISPGSIMVREGKKAVGLMVNGHDITEYKKQEAEMRYLASLPEENPNPVLRVRKNGSIDYKNKASFKLFDRKSTTDMIGLDEKWQKEIDESLATKMIRRGERVKGDKFFSYSIVPADSGEYANIYALDITDRKAEEEAKMAERRKAENYLNVAAVIIVAIDKNQLVTLINKKGCEILGYEKEEIIGKNWFDNFLEKKDIEKIKKVFDCMIKGTAEIVSHHENYIVSKDGRKKLIAWNNTVLSDDNGVFIGTLSSGEDISERKKIETKLEKLAKEWSATFDSMTDGISLLDADNKIVNVNQALCAMLGKTKEGIINKKCYEVFGCLTGKNADCPLKNTPQSNFKKIEIYDETLKKWLFISTSGIYDENGQLEKIIHVTRDITERKKFEEETKKRNMELEKFNSLMIGREEKMIQLKKSLRELETKIIQIKNEKI